MTRLAGSSAAAAAGSSGGVTALEAGGLLSDCAEVAGIPGLALSGKQQTRGRKVAAVWLVCGGLDFRLYSGYVKCNVCTQ